MTAYPELRLFRYGRRFAIDFCSGYAVTPGRTGLKAAAVKQKLWTPALAIVLRPKVERSILNYGHHRLHEFMPCCRFLIRICSCEVFTATMILLRPEVSRALSMPLWIKFHGAIFSKTSILTKRPLKRLGPRSDLGFTPHGKRPDITITLAPINVSVSGQ